jgi:hypothetical protein
MDYIMVYRVVDEEDVGVYRGTIIDTLDGLTRETTPKHPSPCDDKTIGNSELWKTRETLPLKGEEVLFGFSSIQQYKHWFYNFSWQEKLAESGCKIRVFSVPKDHCVVSNAQVIFNSTEATLVKTLCPNTLKDKPIGDI